MIERQPVLLEDQVSAIGGNPADARDVLHFAACRFDLNTRNGAEQVGEILGRDPLDFFLAEGVHCIGHIEPALGAGASRHDDVRLRRLFCSCLRFRSGRLGCILFRSDAGH